MKNETLGSCAAGAAPVAGSANSLDTAVVSVGRGSFVAAAVSTDYPAQLMHLAAKDNAKVLTENGTSDGAALSLTNAWQ